MSDIFNFICTPDSDDTYDDDFLTSSSAYINVYDDDYDSCDDLCDDLDSFDDDDEF